MQKRKFPQTFDFLQEILLCGYKKRIYGKGMSLVSLYFTYIFIYFCCSFVMYVEIN